MSVGLADLARTLADEGVEVLRHGALPLACPADEGGLATLLRRATLAGRRVVPLGMGTDLACLRPEVDFRRPGADAPLLVSTRRLAQVVAYEPGDGTLTAQAGCRMQQLAACVAAGGHRMTPDLPLAAERTLGGVLAGGLSAPDRLRYGPVRHHVLGMRVATADGTVAKSGGRLVKNVTGFDMHRLYCGSRGTLAVILEACLRLFPEPEGERVLCAPFDDAAAALSAAERLRTGPLRSMRPLSIHVDSAGGGAAPRLCVILAGRERQVAADAADLRGRLPELEQHGGSDAAAERGRLFDRCGIGSSRSSLYMLCPPSHGPALLLERAAADLERLGYRGRFHAQPAVARYDLWIEEPRVSEPELANLLGELARRLRPLGARLVPHALPAAVHAALAPRPEELPGSEWMEGLRRALDPRGSFASPWFPTRA